MLGLKLAILLLNLNLFLLGLIFLFLFSVGYLIRFHLDSFFMYFSVSLCIVFLVVALGITIHISPYHSLSVYYHLE